MKLETILNAMCETYHADEFDDYEKASRQYRAFRDRILWMHRKRDFQAATSFELWTTERGIANDLRRQLKEKDHRIAELEGLIDEVVALDPLFPDELMDKLKGVE